MVSIYACGSPSLRTTGKNISPEVTTLKNVQTYTWITGIDEIPDKRIFMSGNGIYVYNNNSARKKIKEAIEYELNARGYTKEEKHVAPDMLVSFFVLEQSDTLRRTRGYVTIDGEPVISSSDVEMVPVQPGTLIISLINNDTQEMVWQGFASGIIKPDDLKRKSKIRQAVSSIFSQFSYDAIDD